MPSAAGIIMATGLMTLANEAVQGNAPLSSAPEKVNWKVVPATLVAAGIFYALEQGIGDAAKVLAGLVFFTAFVGGDTLARPELSSGTTTPLGTLLGIFGYENRRTSVILAPGTRLDEQGIPTVIQ